MVDYRDMWLSEILSCGYGDLSTLEDYEGDITDIIERCKDINNLNLNGILVEIFLEVRYFLQEQINAGDWKEKLYSEIVETMMDIADSEDITIEEIDVSDYDELNEMIQFQKRLLEHGEDIVDIDFNYYTNYMDSNMYLKDLELYKKFFDIESIEYHSGFYFGNG